MSPADDLLRRTENNHSTETAVDFRISAAFAATAFAKKTNVWLADDRVVSPVAYTIHTSRGQLQACQAGHEDGRHSTHNHWQSSIL